MIPQISATADRPGERLDHFLARRFPWLSRSDVAELLQQQHVRCNGRPAAKGLHLAVGDCVEGREIPEASDLRLRPNPELPLRVLWADDALLALDKPAGMPTHPLRPAETDTLANALLARHPELAAIGESPLFPALLHRLDTATSGLILAARTPAAYAHLRRQFQDLRIEKHYLAWVHGPVDAPGRNDAPLTHQTRTPCKMRPLRPDERLPERNQFPATSTWIPVRREKDDTLLDVTIRSGVTHQIRCHLAAAGHPILGDRTYGSPLPLSRHLLHAFSLHLHHPVTGLPLTVEAPPPADFAPPSPPR